MHCNANYKTFLPRMTARVLIVLGCLSLLAGLYAQEEDPAIKELRRQWNEYKRKQTSSMTITIIGGVALAGGCAFIAANWNQLVPYQNGPSVGVHVGNAGAAWGIILSIAGLPTVITGTVQLIKANRELRYFRRVFGEGTSDSVKVQDELL